MDEFERDEDALEHGVEEPDSREDFAPSAEEEFGELGGIGESPEDGREQPMHSSSGVSGSDEEGPGEGPPDAGHAQIPDPWSENDEDNPEEFESDSEGELNPEGTSTDHPSIAVDSGRDTHIGGTRTNHVHGDQENIWGDYYDNSVTSESKEAPAFDPLPKSTASRVAELFVEPTNYKHPANLLGDTTNRIILVHGADRTGKWTCAVALAMEIVGWHAEQASSDEESPLEIVEYSRQPHSDLSLIEAMRAEELPESAVILLRDAFEQNIRPEELEPNRLDSLAQQLGDQSYLIITGDLSQERLGSLLLPKINAQVQDLKEVLRKHLTAAVANHEIALNKVQLDRLVATWPHLKQSLTTPFEIQRFCSDLCLQDLPQQLNALPSVAIRIAKDIGTGLRRAVRKWFDDLSPNEQLLASLVYLFPRAQRRWLEALGHRLVSQLRESGLSCYSDPRELGLDDMRARIHAAGHGQYLQFEDRAYEAEAQRQVLNRQHLLQEPIRRLRKLTPEEDWRQPWKRKLLGMALGRLGLHDVHWLNPILEELATKKEMWRAVVAAYGLEEIFRQDPGAGYRLVKKVLQSWIQSKNPCKMWTASAALWRLYETTLDFETPGERRDPQDQFIRFLVILTRENHFLRLKAQQDGKQGSEFDRVEWCIADALKRLLLFDSQAVLEMLQTWLSDTKTHHSVAVGRKTIRKVTEKLASDRTKPSRLEQIVYLTLLGPLLKAASEKTLVVRMVFLTLRGWLQWPEVAKGVRRQLLELTLNSTAQQRHRLRATLMETWIAEEPKTARRDAYRLVKRKYAQALLDFWCKDTAPQARKIAQEVVARCHAMDGFLPCLPTMGNAIVVVDSALLLKPQAREQFQNANGLWRLLSLLESRMDVQLLRLGETSSLDLLDEDHLADVELHSRFPGHRLLMPGLEATLDGAAEATASQENPQTRMVFVMAPTKPHDFGDLERVPSVDKVYYLGPTEMDNSILHEWHRHIELPWPPTSTQLDKAEGQIEAEWARALALASPAQWIELLEDLEISHLKEPQEAEALLERWAFNVEEILPERPQDDPVWKVVVLTLWLAARDLPTCLEGLASWLAPSEIDPEASPKRAMGAAGCFALIRLFTAYPPAEDGRGRAPTELFGALAEPLGRQGPDGVDAVVRLVEHWMLDPAWMVYLAGDVQEGKGRLERWTEDFLVDRPDLAERLLKKLESASQTADGEESWAALLAVLDRLEARRRLEHPKSLPTLSEGQKYALLVVGSRSENQEIHWSLSRTAASLYGSLVELEEHLWVPVLCRLGERHLFWVDATQRPDPQRLLPSTTQLPGLIGPIFQTLKDLRDRIGHIVLITDTPPIDLEDWAESAWWSKLRLYGGDSPPAAIRFDTLPVPAQPSSQKRGTDLTRWQVNQLQAHLFPRPKSATPIQQETEP